MPDLDINDLTTLGLFGDLAPSKLPPEAWTTALNMRYEDGRVKRIGGRTQSWTPSVAPYFSMYVVSPAGVPWWLYASLTKTYAFDFTTHSDITRTSGGDYGASVANDWFGTVLGSIPIITSGNDAVQFWSAFSGSTALTPLTNWDANHKCKVIRAFGNHLIALGIDKSGTVYPHLVKWSHPAVAGAVPSSWDVADTTKDAGEHDLADVGSGKILDGMQLGSLFYIYKERSTWSVRYIGGRFIFDFDTFLAESGLMAPHCVTKCVQGRFHFMMTEDNMLIHDGSQVLPLLDRRMRNTVFNRIDEDNKASCFVFHHPKKNEVWACYPETGNSVPTRALIWNYAEGGRAGVLSEAEVDFVAATQGALEMEAITWAGETSLGWEADNEPWSVGNKAVVITSRGASATKNLELDAGLTNDGSTFTATLARDGLAMIGRKRNSEDWIVDWSKYKLVTRVWIVGEGGPITVRIGSQAVPEGSVTWTSSASFDPATDRFVDLVISGPGISIEFSTTTSVDWSLVSYMMVTNVVSRH